MLLLFRLFALLPLTALHGLGWLTGWLVFLCAPTYRRRFLANAAQAGFSFRAVRGAVGAAGQMALELPRLWFGPPAPIEWRGAEHIEAALASGQGLLLLTPHLGCFEICAQAYAQRFGLGVAPITVLFRPPRHPWLRPVVADARARPGLLTAAADLGGVKQMLQALRQRQTVGMLPDQVPPEGLGCWTRFFGRSAYTMTLAARLVRQTGAQRLLLWGERLPWGRGFRVHVQRWDEPLAPEPSAAAAQFNAAMEGLIRTAPEQYLWGYNRYKHPRQADKA